MQDRALALPGNSDLRNDLEIRDISRKLPRSRDKHGSITDRPGKSSGDNCRYGTLGEDLAANEVSTRVSPTRRYRDGD